MATSLSQLTLRDLMDAGLHFGHQTKRWNPKMKKYIYDKRNGIHIIDITQSLDLLDQALAFAKKVAEDGGRILFVGTKKQAQEVVKTAAEECGAFYMTNRWLGGTLTNAQTIRKSVRRMEQIHTIANNNNGVLSPHKKEAASLRRELDKLQQNLVGIADMDRLPAAVYVVDVVREKNAVAEARRCLRSFLAFLALASRSIRAPAIRSSKSCSLSFTVPPLPRRFSHRPPRPQRYSNIPSASSLRTVSCTFRTRTFTVRFPKPISSTSPAFTS